MPEGLACPFNPAGMGGGKRGAVKKLKIAPVLVRNDGEYAFPAAPARKPPGQFAGQVRAQIFNPGPETFRNCQLMRLKPQKPGLNRFGCGQGVI